MDSLLLNRYLTKQKPIQMRKRFFNDDDDLNNKKCRVMIAFSIMK